MTKNDTIKKPTKKTKQPDIVVDNTKLKLVLSWDEIKKEYDRVLKNSSKNIKAQGFRQGKAPLKIAEGKLGKDRLINKVLEVIIPPKYQELIEKEKKEPLTQPEVKPIKMDWGKDWELEIHIAEKPILKLDGYKKSTKKGLKAAVKQLKEQKNTATKDKTKEVKLHQIFKSLVEDIQPQIPELLLKDETKREIQRLAKELEKIGLSLDDYLARRKQKFEEMSSQVAAQALGQLQLEFVLRGLEELEEIKVLEADKKLELDKIKDQKLKQQAQKDPQYSQYLTSQIKRRKLFDQILEIK